MTDRKPASIERALDLDASFIVKLPFLANALLAPRMTGNPDYTYIRFGTDDTTRQKIRQGNRWKWPEAKEIWIVNTQAQVGQKLELVLGGPDVELQGADQILAQMVNKADVVIDPATEDKQDDGITAIGAVETAIVALQAAAETIQDVIDAVDDRVVKADTPTLYHVTITNPDTEYSQALPAHTKKFSVHLQDFAIFRVAYAAGKVATPTAPYLTIPAGSEHYQDALDVSGLTLYIADPVGTKVAEIEVWV